MRGAAVFMALIILLAPAAGRGEDDARSIENTRKELEAVEDRKESAERKLRSSQDQERSILAQLESIERAIARTGERIDSLRRDEQEIRVNISRTQEDLARVEKDMARIRERLSSRAAALYKAGNVSYLELVLGSTGVEDLERRVFYLKRVSEHDSGLFSRAADLLQKERQQKEALIVERNQLASTRQALETDLKSLARRKRSRDLLLASARDKKEKYTRLVAELEESSERLIKLLDALNQQAATGESAFPVLRGTLRRPVSGKIIVGFGRNVNARFNTYTLSRGVTIRSAEGTPVRSVYKGKILFADWFRGYGRIIIVDHGGGYYTLYGHLAAINVQVGQQIEADDTIGLVGDSGSLEGPALYFEIRHHGKPVDPQPWFSG